MIKYQYRPSILVENQLLIAVVTIAAIVTTLYLRGYDPMTDEYRQLSRYDSNLIVTAESLDGLLPEQQYYVKLVGRRLLSLNTGRINSLISNQLLSFATMAATYLAVGITGTDYVECNSAKSTSFGINLLAALLLASNQLFAFEKTALHCEKMASYFRWELEQFVGASREYMGLSIQDRYNQFTARTDELIEKDIKGRRENSNGGVPVKGTLNDDEKRILEQDRLNRL